jgi:hypothetical protein
MSLITNYLYGSGDFFSSAPGSVATDSSRKHCMESNRANKRQLHLIPSPSSESNGGQPKANKKDIVKKILLSPVQRPIYNYLKLDSSNFDLGLDRITAFYSKNTERSIISQLDYLVTALIMPLLDEEVLLYDDDRKSSNPSTWDEYESERDLQELNQDMLPIMRHSLKSNSVRFLESVFSDSDTNVKSEELLILKRVVNKLLRKLNNDRSVFLDKTINDSDSLLDSFRDTFLTDYPSKVLALIKKALEISNDPDRVDQLSTGSDMMKVFADLNVGSGAWFSALDAMKPDWISSKDFFTIAEACIEAFNDIKHLLPSTEDTKANPIKTIQYISAFNRNVDPTVTKVFKQMEIPSCVYQEKVSDGLPDNLKIELFRLNDDIQIAQNALKTINEIKEVLKNK